MVTLLVDLPEAMSMAELCRLLEAHGVVVHARPAEGTPPPGDPVDTPAFRLAPAERAVLRAFTWCDSNKEIARLLGMGTATVKTHVERLYQKLGVSSRAHAVGRALRLGLLTLPELENRALLSAERRIAGSAAGEVS